MMESIIVLIVYIVGVCMAYRQLLCWNDGAATQEEYQMLFMFSLLSWLIYPLYGIVLLHRKYGKE